MNTFVIIAIVVTVAIIAGVAANTLSKSNFNRTLAIIQKQKEDADSALADASENLRRISEELQSKNLRIQGLEKDVEYKKEELENAKRGFEERLSQSETQHQKHIDDLKSENEKVLREQKADHEKNVAALKDDYNKRLEENRQNNEKALKLQIDAVKAQISAESEKVLKARQEEFSKHAEESFSTIAGDFNKNLKEMKEAFDANKEKQDVNSAELRTQIGEAVKNLKDQTENVGLKADHLANALRGQHKMQGCWGETQLNNILVSEGFVEGRDYDKEETLRDEMGIVIVNEDTGKRMRPDFILHYPDNTDIIVDSKAPLNALSDYFDAENDEQRKDAAERNLKALKEHIDCLAKKDYHSYLKPGHKCLDYTVMFVPNVNAIVLARQSDPHIIADAYNKKNVLIVSEETLMPFLRLVRTAWVNFEQAKNQERIVAAAQKMVDRVALFCDAYAKVGKKIKDAQDAFDEGDIKLRENGPSILHAAREVEQLGIKSKKNLPPMVGEVLIEAEPADEQAA